MAANKKTIYKENSGNDPSPEERVICNDLLRHLINKQCAANEASCEGYNKLSLSSVNAYTVVTSEASYKSNNVSCLFYNDMYATKDKEEGYDTDNMLSLLDDNATAVSPSPEAVMPAIEAVMLEAAPTERMSDGCGGAQPAKAKPTKAPSVTATQA